MPIWTKMVTGIVLLLLLGTSGPAAALTGADLEAFFDGMIAAQMGDYTSPGVVLAVVHDGDIVLAKGYGWADRASRTPVDPETTLFRTGSNSKLFVWNAVMQLVEAGKLDLDTNVNEYLDFSLPDTLRDGTPGDPITLRHLMTHTAGFEDVLTEVFVNQSEQVRPLGEYLRNVPARVYPAGEMAVYSNYGSSLAAYIVQRVSDTDFQTYVEEELFAPLEMDFSTFRQPLPEALRGKQATGYLVHQGQPQAAEFEFLQSYPAGSLSSSAVDMARFMNSQLNLGAGEDARILDEDTAAYMQETHFTHDQRMPGMTLGYIEGRYNGRRVLLHGGDTIQFHTGLFLLPDENTGLYVSYNGADTALARAVLFNAFMDRYFPADEAPDSEVLPVDPSQYSGFFMAARSNFTGPEAWLSLIQQTTVGVDEDGLLTMLTMGRLVRYEQTEPGFFVSQDGSARMAAVFDDSEQAVRLLTNSPFPLIRVPWYASLPVLAIVLVGGLAAFLVSGVCWLRRLVGENRLGKQASALRLRILGSLFAAVLLGTTLLFGLALLETSPVYGLPNMFFETPVRLYQALQVLSFVLALLAAAMAITSAVAWARRWDSLWGRIHFSVLSLWGVGIAAFLHYVNFLRLPWIS